MVPWEATSSLHNSGETIRLLRPDGTLGDIVTYSDTDGWTSEADGMGATLEWKGGNWDNSQPEAWVGSNALGGSPEATTAHGPTDSMRSDLLELLIDTRQRLSRRRVTVVASWSTRTFRVRPRKHNLNAYEDHADGSIVLK